MNLIYLTFYETSYLYMKINNLRGYQSIFSLQNNLKNISQWFRCINLILNISVLFFSFYMIGYKITFERKNFLDKTFYTCFVHLLHCEYIMSYHHNQVIWVCSLIICNKLNITYIELIHGKYLKQLSNNGTAKISLLPCNIITYINVRR